MITKTALIAALVLGTASVAMAQDFDGNLANRYPAYAEPLSQQTHSSQVLEGRNVALTGRPSVIEAQDSFDRASNPSAGGGW